MSTSELIEKPAQKPHSDPACSCDGCRIFKVFIDLGLPPPDHVWEPMPVDSGPLPNWADDDQVRAFLKDRGWHVGW